SQPSFGSSCVGLEFGGIASARKLVAGADPDPQPSQLVTEREVGDSQDDPGASWFQRNTLLTPDPAASAAAARTSAVGVEGLAFAAGESALPASQGAFPFGLS